MQSQQRCVCVWVFGAGAGEQNKEEGLISKDSSGARIRSEAAACLERGLLPTPPALLTGLLTFEKE